MKKIIVIMSIFLMISVLNQKDYNFDDMIRFRIISNSNSAKDIIIKQQVSDKVSKILFDKGNTREDVRNNIIENINLIEAETNKVFNENNYSKKFNINYGYNYFPEKEFDGKRLKEGIYESLVLTIGEGKGDNYWCILYPPLCMIDNTKEVKNKIEYKFKIIEYIKNFFDVNYV